MNQVVICVGSNIDPEKHVEEARRTLRKEQKLMGESKFIWTEPVGNSQQPRFLNGAFLVATGMEREGFEVYCKDLEKRLGRKKRDSHAPREIDLDVTVWNGEIVHSDFYKRDFVRESVFELLPDLRQRGEKK